MKNRPNRAKSFALRILLVLFYCRCFSAIVIAFVCWLLFHLFCTRLNTLRFNFLIVPFHFVHVLTWATKLYNNAKTIEFCCCRFFDGLFLLFWLNTTQESKRKKFLFISFCLGFCKT